MKDKAIKDAMNDIEKIIRDVYSQGYNDGLKDGKTSVQIDETEAYEAGLEAAWELARKMYQYNPVNNKQLCEELFDMNFNEFICTISPSEAIAKIKEYEEKQTKQCCKSVMTLDESIKWLRELKQKKADERRRGMTNGEKIKEIYPRTPVGVRLDVDSSNGTITFTTNNDWWNAEYKEPTTQDSITINIDVYQERK